MAKLATATLLTDKLELVLVETDVSYEIRLRAPSSPHYQLLFTEGNRNTAAAMYHDFIEMFRSIRPN